jgi:hypothetical protein
MKWIKADDEPGKHTAEKVLPRGLEQVSHLFLSQPTLNGGDLPAAPSISHEKTSGPEEEHPLAVVPRRFLKREQLLSLLGKQPEALEEGMRLIDRNIPSESSGSIELLALDCTNQLSIIDLDTSPNDALLVRGLGHFDWIVRNHSIVKRMYPEQPIDFSLQPRLILVAPEFSPLLRSVVRLIAVPRIHCMKYHAVGMDGDAGVYFERIQS